ncbi:MAG: hypothetical protein K9K66_00900 [Desulfarculaceae bacterium]|nr:hypothetical protein [Desulfarculaceae bacterium]MCF8072271.1 hypothetical protein [Desulfarculaceae bacterium]MCF8100192.1 hypothetical protein [Desulfarculaceae bacterium]MCF8117864.1 hypothetical protein [Desulfarculaceae bacterium]
MNPLRATSIFLAWLGRQGTRALAALVLLGIAWPWLGEQLKPWVSEAVFVLLALAFLRLDPARLRAYLGRPLLVILATLYNGLATPLVFGLACGWLGMEAAWPALFTGLVLQAVTPPMMATPALAALMGLDATLVLVSMVLGSALVPFTAPLLGHWFLGEGLALEPMALGLKLLGLLAGSALTGLVLRRLAGAAAIERRRAELDGLNVLVLFVFVAAIMGGVGPAFLAAPLATLGLTALAFGVFFLLLAATTGVFLWAGRDRALALGVMAASRNLGLMLAALGPALPGLTWLYFALSQFPIYLAPHMLRPLARRWTGAGQ